MQLAAAIQNTHGNKQQIKFMFIFFSEYFEVKFWSFKNYYYIADTFKLQIIII